MPLHISVVTGSPVPMYRQIMEQIGAAVASGRLAEGEGLPAVRVLADRLQINPNTVARAYKDLASEGIIESYGTRGMFVAPRRQLYTKAEGRQRTDALLNTFVAEALVMGFTAEEMVAQLEDKVEELSLKRSGNTKGG